MNYDAWFLFFLGMVSSILLVNVVQWIMYGERVYGLYVLYTLAWITYFVVRHLPLPDNVLSFARVAGPITAYMFYFALVADFLHVWKQRPKLHRPYQILQISLLLYCLVKAYMCFVQDHWTPATHDLVQNIFRFILIAVAIYVTALFFRSKDTVSRFFVVGTTLMVVTHLVTVSLSVRITDMNYVWNSWRNPYPYMQAGIVLDLMVFSIGLSYRHRREAIRKATVERELDYEREQRHREHLQAELTMQQLKHEKTEMHMRALQSQINPHFLFNSLNSLSALIGDNPQKAEQFVDQMSVVYRYLLQAGDRELTTVASELAFIHAYGNLLTTRFGRGISIELAVSEASRDWLLPPLTLQLLVENAVKHNVVHSGKPLRIEIRTDQANRLIVSNNLQRKPIRQVLSSGKGLANISEKYRLLNLPGIKVSESADVFSVEIPLIESVLKAA